MRLRQKTGNSARLSGLRLVCFLSVSACAEEPIVKAEAEEKDEGRGCGRAFKMKIKRQNRKLKNVMGKL